MKYSLLCCWLGLCVTPVACSSESRGSETDGSPVEDGSSSQKDGGGDDSCSVLSDVSDLIGTNDLFIGYASLGADVSAPGCGSLANAREIYLSLTPGFDGELVLSTVHPTTREDTVIEVREESCDGPALGCAEGATTGEKGARLTISVEAGRSYVAMVETTDDIDGVFALSLHREGVCEGVGTAEEITGDLLSGRLFVADTANGTATMHGSCSDPGDENPEALFAFTAPLSGVFVATTVHPDTNFDPLLYARRGGRDSEDYCDSPEVEIGCENDTAPWGTDPVLRFDVEAGRLYSLFVDGGSSGAQGQATVVLGYEAASPAEASLLGCNHAGIRDRFAFFAESGQAVYVKADTTDAATAADLRFRIHNPDSSQLHEADDDVACTYPPPAYECPEYSFTAGTEGLFFVEVYVGASERCYDRTLVNYLLTVTVDSQQSDLILVQDQ